MEIPKKAPGRPNRQYPSQCIARNPTGQSIEFCGAYINLSHIAFKTGITPGYLSRLFSGRRYPSLRTAKRIASALGMNLPPFIKAFDAHYSLRRPYVKPKGKPSVEQTPTSDAA